MYSLKNARTAAAVREAGAVAVVWGAGATAEARLAAEEWAAEAAVNAAGRPVAEALAMVATGTEGSESARMVGGTTAASSVEATMAVVAMVVETMARVIVAKVKVGVALAVVEVAMAVEAGMSVVAAKEAAAEETMAEDWGRAEVVKGRVAEAMGAEAVVTGVEAAVQALEVLEAAVMVAARTGVRSVTASAPRSGSRS